MIEYRLLALIPAVLQYFYTSTLGDAANFMHSPSFSKA